MSIDTRPPSAQVSMADLMSLPPQQLAAMANNQQPSIAPPWMVTSALNAVNQMKAGQQQPQQQGTIKNQVVQQAMQAQQHPMAQGIGSIPAPVPGQQQVPASQPPAPQTQPQQGQAPQGMAGGGAVRHFDAGGSTGILGWLSGLDASMKNSVRSSLVGNPLPSMTPAGTDSRGRQIYVPGSSATSATSSSPTVTPSSIPHGNTAYGDLPSDPAFRIGTPEFNAQFADDIAHGANFNPGAQAYLLGSASSDPTNPASSAHAVVQAAAAGSSLPGTNPLSKYIDRPVGVSHNDVTMPDINDTPDLTPPEATHLNSALAYYEDPNGAAAKSVQGAGLAAYAAQMNPSSLHVGDLTGFGGRSAASDAAQFAAQQARADYIQGKAETLGSTADQLAQNQYSANVAHKEAQQAENLGLAKFNVSSQTEAYKTQVMAAVDAERNRLMADANALQAQIRIDGMTQAHEAQLAQMKRDSQAAVLAEANAMYPADPMTGYVKPEFATMKGNYMSRRNKEEWDKLQGVLAPVVAASQAGAAGRQATVAPGNPGAGVGGLGGLNGQSGLSGVRGVYPGGT